MYHHTKTKGDLGVLKAQVNLYEQGYTILLPLTEHAPFDLVAYKDGQFYRIQVKYRSLSKDGTLEVKLQSYWHNHDGIQRKKQNIDNIDIVCVFCPDTNQCYYVPTQDIQDVCFKLRLEPTRNNQTHNVKYAKDYLILRS
jgi:hypothetical protein